MKGSKMNNVSWFSTNDQIFQLKKPIRLTLTEYDNGFYAENTQYNVAGVGTTEKEAIEDARINLGFLYEWKFETKLPIPLEIPEWIEKIDALIEV